MFALFFRNSDFISKHEQAIESTAYEDRYDVIDQIFSERFGSSWFFKDSKYASVQRDVENFYKTKQVEFITSNKDELITKIESSNLFDSRLKNFIIENPNVLTPPKKNPLYKAIDTIYQGYLWTKNAALGKRKSLTSIKAEIETRDALDCAQKKAVNDEFNKILPNIKSIFPLKLINNIPLLNRLINKQDYVDEYKLEHISDSIVEMDEAALHTCATKFINRLTSIKGLFWKHFPKFSSFELKQLQQLQILERVLADSTYLEAKGGQRLKELILFNHLKKRAFRKQLGEIDQVLKEKNLLASQKNIEGILDTKRQNIRRFSELTLIYADDLLDNLSPNETNETVLFFCGKSMAEQANKLSSYHLKRLTNHLKKPSSSISIDERRFLKKLHILTPQFIKHRDLNEIGGLNLELLLKEQFLADVENLNQEQVTRLTSFFTNPSTQLSVTEQNLLRQLQSIYPELRKDLRFNIKSVLNLEALINSATQAEGQWLKGLIENQKEKEPLSLYFAAYAFAKKINKMNSTDISRIITFLDDPSQKITDEDKVLLHQLQILFATYQENTALISYGGKNLERLITNADKSMIALFSFSRMINEISDVFHEMSKVEVLNLSKSLPDEIWNKQQINNTDYTNINEKLYVSDYHRPVGDITIKEGDNIIVKQEFDNIRRTMNNNDESLRSNFIETLYQLAEQDEDTFKALQFMFRQDLLSPSEIRGKIINIPYEEFRNDQLENIASNKNNRTLEKLSPTHFRLTIEEQGTISFTDQCTTQEHFLDYQNNSVYDIIKVNNEWTITLLPRAEQKFHFDPNSVTRFEELPMHGFIPIEETNL